MTRKTPEFLIDQAADLVASNVSLVAIGKMFDVHPDILSKHLRARGIEILHRIPPQKRRADLDENLIVETYRGGSSELALSIAFHCNRRTIFKILDRNGVERRTASQANVRRMQRIGPEGRRRIISAARTARFANLRRAAINGIAHPSIGPGEREIAEALERRGHTASRQEMIGPYCIDIVTGSLAVEIKQKRFLNFSPRNNIKRSEQIIERGLTLVFVIFDSAECVAPALDEVISALEILSSNPSPSSEYWMIRCKLEPTAFVLDQDERSFVPTPEKVVTTIRKGYWR